MHFIRLPRHVQNTPRAKRTNERDKPTAAGRQAAGSNRAPLMIIGVLQGQPEQINGENNFYAFLGLFVSPMVGTKLSSIQSCIFIIQDRNLC